MSTARSSTSCVRQFIGAKVVNPRPARLRKISPHLSDVAGWLLTPLYRIILSRPIKSGQMVQIQSGKAFKKIVGQWQRLFGRDVKQTDL